MDESSLNRDIPVTRCAEATRPALSASPLQGRIILGLLALLLGLILAYLLTPARIDAGQAAFGPGESLLYDIRFGPLSTGSARILVGSDRPGDGSEIWPIVVQARTNAGVSRVFEVRDRFVSFWDPLKSRSFGFDFHAREGGERRFTRARLDHATGQATVRKRKGNGSDRTRTLQVGNTSHDLASAIFLLRTRPLALGDQETVRVFTGDETWALQAKVEGRETLDTALGPRQVVRVRFRTHFNGKLAARRQILVWFTDDVAHIPVEIQADLVLGSIRAEIAGYTRGL